MYNPEYDRDFSLQSISRWLMEVIRLTYADSTLCDSPRVHEIRAWSASLAFPHSVPLHAVMEAAFWKNDGTFIPYYLRDVRRRREDGSFGVAAAVVAQSALASI